MLTDTSYAKYVHERCGAKILEENSNFVVYRINGFECFIMEFYISEESRRAGKAREFISRLESIASENDCTHITGDIFLEANGAQDALISALLIGFKVVNTNGKVLIIAKEVGGK
jgi:hypothetical protein